VNDIPSQAYADILARLLEHAGSSPDRWTDLVDLLDKVAAPHGNLLVESLDDVDASDWSANQRTQVSEALRALGTKHLRYTDMPWAMPAAQAQRIMQLAERFAEEDVVLRCKWVFADHVELPEPIESDWATTQTRLAEEQVRAIDAVFPAKGLAGVRKLASLVPSPWRVGVALSDSMKVDDTVALILEAHHWPEPLGEDFLRGFLIRLLERGGAEQVRTLLDDPRLRDASAELRGFVWSCGPFEEATWVKVAAEGVEVHRVYWNTVGLYGRGLLDTVVDVIAENLMRAANLAGAIRFLALYREAARPERVLEILELSTSSAYVSTTPWTALSHDVLWLVEFLQGRGVDQDRVATLEWQLLPVFPISRHEPRALEEKLARDPAFFNEVLALAFRPRGANTEGPEPETDAEAVEVSAQRAHRAFRLLWDWRRPPGMTSQGHLDAQQLTAWVRAARETAAANRRLGVCDDRIGSVLAYSPVGVDGVWPDEAARDLMESPEFDSDALRLGFVVGVQNTHGATWRVLGAGGDEERTFAQRYRSDAAKLRHRWPRTGAVLSRIAEAYDAQAHREDQEAARERHDAGLADHSEA
jgi:hypothetical protein